jgi:hypothetical protein
MKIWGEALIFIKNLIAWLLASVDDVSVWPPLADNPKQLIEIPLGVRIRAPVVEASRKRWCRGPTFLMRRTDF